MIRFPKIMPQKTAGSPYIFVCKHIIEPVCLEGLGRRNEEPLRIRVSTRA